MRWLLPLALALALVCAPLAEASARSAASGPSAAAAKKKKKKCKSKKRKKQTAFSGSTRSAEAAAKKRKKGKCKKKGSGSGGGLPGKPLSPNPPDPPDPPEEPDPPLVQNLTLTENPLLAGTSGTGRVTLNGPAPSGGQTVALGSDTPSRATVPDSVQVAAGQTQATFPIDTTVGGPTTVLLTAAVDTSFRTTQLDIVDEADLQSLSLDYQCFPGDDLNDFGTNTVTLNVRAPGNEVVQLDSSDPFALAVPSNVVVAQGSFHGVFTVDTLATTPSVTVTGTYNGAMRSDTASVRDENSPDPVADFLAFSPQSIVVGDPSTGTVTLDCEAPPGGINVSLSTSYPGLTIPGSVTVPAGELSANFPITTIPSMTPGEATISAAAPTGPAVQANLTLRAIGS